MPATRRRFLLGAGASLLAAPALVSCTGSRWRSGDPFSLGVAAGEPSPDGFVLWTRLAPQPLLGDPTQPGGLSGGAIPLAYEVASDSGMRNIVRRGQAMAEPADGFSVHLEIAGLEPGRPYWYRFLVSDAVSRTGRAMTLPAADSRPDRLKFGFVSCANYEHGYFAAYRHLAEERPDLVLFLGDYFYEYVDQRPGKVREHSGGSEAATLPAYRNRYAQYKLDADLQLLHADCTTLITWDDHEVQNDYAGQWAPDFSDPRAFLQRRAAAYQAFYEHMPVRPRKHPRGPDMLIYDRFRIGDLAEIAMLDGRQYRSREACYGPPNKGGGHLESNRSCPERLLESRSMLGDLQERWLYDGLGAGRARWNLFAQDVLMAQLKQRNREQEVAFWTDGWDGYPTNRARLLREIHDRRIANPVVLTGDIHSFWANDLKLDFDDPRSPTVATELVGSSVSSRGPNYQTFMGFLPDNPHVRFFDSRKRGYVSVDLTRERLTARFRALSDVQDPNASVSTLKTFTVEDGRTGAQV